MTAMLSIIIIINMKRNVPFSILGRTSMRISFRVPVQTLNIDNR